jgi:hypothetical protein
MKQGAKADAGKMDASYCADTLLASLRSASDPALRPEQVKTEEGGVRAPVLLHLTLDREFFVVDHPLADYVLSKS